MSDVIKDISLDISKLTQFVVIKLQQGESLIRKLDVSITEDEHIYQIPDTAAIQLILAKPDGTIVYNSCNWSNNKIRVEITPQMTNIAKKIPAQIIITDLATGGVVKTLRFHFLIEPAVFLDGMIASVSEVGALTEMMVSVREMNDNEDTRLSQESARVENENIRIQTEDIRISNEDLRLANDAPRPLYFYKTQAEYDALPQEDKDNPKHIYEITDDDGVFPSELQNLIDDTNTARTLAEQLVINRAGINDTNATLTEAYSGSKTKTLIDQVNDLLVDVDLELASIMQQKSNIAYVDEKIAAIASGSPKNTFADLASLQADATANTIEGKKYIYIVITDGNWYYWKSSTSSWTPGGVYQTSLSLTDKTGNSTAKVLTQEAITKELGVVFSNTGYVTNDGTIISTDIYRRKTDFIRISRNSDINFLGESNNPFVSAIAFFDKDKNFISGVYNNQTTITAQTVTTANIPTNAVYIILSTTTALLSMSFVYFGGIQNVINAVESSTNGKIWLNSLDIMHKSISKKVGKNLFNKDSITSGYYIDAAGTLRALANYYVSDFIPIEPGTQYYFKEIGINSGGACTVFYDINRKVVSYYHSDDPMPNPVTTPANAYYIRSTSGQLSTLASAQIEKGTSYTGYEAYTEYSPIGVLAKEVASSDSKFANKLDKKIGKNLFNKAATAILEGQYLNSNGALSNNYLYYVSDYMPVLPNTAYYHSNFALGGAYACIYDTNKVFVSSFKNTPITIPTNGAFVRMSGTISEKAIQQFEKGSIATFYEAYTENADLMNLANKLPSRDVATILPKRLYFAKDKQGCIYFENVLLKNFNDPTTVFFSAGINYNRQVAFKFTSAISSATFTTQVISNLKRGELKTITYDVVDPAVNNGKTLNVLFIGDSFTDIGSYITEITSLITSKGATVNQIGTCGNGSFKGEGLSGGTLLNTFLNTSAGVARIVNVTGMVNIPSTGFPGQTYRDANAKDWIIRGGKIDGSGNGHLVVTKYGATEADFTSFPASGTLTKQTAGLGDNVINYTNPVSAYHNPFINPSTGLLDITNYITYWGFNTPDEVVFQFTWNDTGTWSTDGSLTTVINNFKLAADHVHTAYPNCKVIFSIEPFGSVNGNKDWNGKKYTVLRFVELLITAIEDDSAYNTWCKIAPSYAFVDLVYGYSSSTVVPCERYAGVTEQSGGDGVHPNSGMLQIADCLYPVMEYFLSLKI